MHISRIWRFLLLMVGFGTTYSLLPLYSSNQNHHFLTGLARAGLGFLNEDWQANTVDPFPVFTWMVTFTHRYLGDWFFYLCYYLLLGAYIASLLRITSLVGFAKRSREETLLVLAVLAVMHCEVLGYLFVVDLQNLPWFQLTHWGIAQQEIFGHSMFQASAFGMLLLTSIALFLTRHTFWAVTVAALVADIHFSYALTAAALTVSYLALTYRREQRLSWALFLGLWALLLVLPVVIHLQRQLGPTSPEIWAAATRILAGHIPQEAIPAHWLGPTVYVKVAMIVSALFIAWGTDLFVIMLVPFLTGLLLTLTQIALESDVLGLLFPWRVSVLLVPMATAVLVNDAVMELMRLGRFQRPAIRRIVTRASLAVIVVAALTGVVRMALNFTYFYGYPPGLAVANRIVPQRWQRDFAEKLNPEPLPMMEFVRNSKVARSVYLIPPELERFRLVTGAPALVDWKSHPYKDVEVLEWDARLRAAQTFYGNESDCSKLDAILLRYPITHVVLDYGRPWANCTGLTARYQDRRYGVYVVDRPRTTKRQ